MAQEHATEDSEDTARPIGRNQEIATENTEDTDGEPGSSPNGADDNSLGRQPQDTNPEK